MSSAEVGRAGALLVLTGSSHSGKSSVARELMSDAVLPTGYVAIDDLMGKLSPGRLDDWYENLPVAYEAALATAKTLLARGLLVIVESTFTFIPSGERDPEFHDSQLAAFTRVAELAGAPWVVVRLRASLDELRRRHDRTGRLTPEIVEGTWHLHATRKVRNCRIIDIDTTLLDVRRVAARVREVLESTGLAAPSSALSLPAPQ